MYIPLVGTWRSSRAFTSSRSLNRCSPGTSRDFIFLRLLNYFFMTFVLLTLRSACSPNFAGKVADSTHTLLTLSSLSLFCQYFKYVCQSALSCGKCRWAPHYSPCKSVMCLRCDTSLLARCRSKNCPIKNQRAA